MKTIYFGNLPANTTAIFLKYIAGKFGRGYNVRVIPSFEEEEPSFGFVDMTDDEADRLLSYFKTHELRYQDTYIKVTLAIGKVSQRSMRISKKKKKKLKKAIERQQKLQREAEQKQNSSSPNTSSSVRHNRPRPMRRKRIR